MAYSRGDDVVLAFEVVALTREPAERARDVGGDRGLLCDDELFCHTTKGADDKCKRTARSTRGETWAHFDSTRARHARVRADQLGRRDCCVLNRSSASSRLVGVCWFHSTISTTSFSCSSDRESPAAASARSITSSRVCTSRIPDCSRVSRKPRHWASSLAASRDAYARKAWRDTGSFSSPPCGARVTPASQCSASLMSESSKPAADSFLAMRSRSKASSVCWQFSKTKTRMSYIRFLSY